ncbi:ABC transporter permease [Desmospora activa]|uniref:ABC-2 type transport system permease protein n=1 Tax=Desmospora activa DSM 45169 TaxID=1121389 RepID=A0A2T4Z0L5_9BACL|nr:ABC-2 family transporter protein [Desmospora activa]PTM53276.1 ABC-2 type transport system permease protein [Desmospora activa DSM 45169]
MVYWELLIKNIKVQFQYRIAHMINNLGSLIFGFIYIAIWVGVLTGKEEGSPYSATDMTHYMAYGQALLWMTIFLTPGLGIPNRVRNGAISLEMARPVSYFTYTAAQEAGRIIYNLCFRSIPILLIFALTVGIHLPTNPISYLWMTVAAAVAIWLSINLHYLIGISACWTYEISGAHFMIVTLLFGLGGQLVPLDLLPGNLGLWAQWLPFAGVLYTPVIIYLEKAGMEALLIPVLWASVLTLFNLWLTGRARRKLEIQGG